MLIFMVIIQTAFFFKNKLTLILEIMAGVNGVFIVAIIPSLYVIKARKLVAEGDSVIFRSRFQHWAMPYFILLVGSAQIFLTVFLKMFYL